MSIAIEPSWDLYGAFLAVMQTGSLSGASRALGVAQPTVRRQIEALEEALGVALFTRAPNGLTPTDVAHTTLPHAEAIAASARALVRIATAPLDADRGTVRITCSEILGAEVLPKMLAPLLHAHPGLSIELVPNNRNEDLLRREADVAIRMIAPTQAGLVRKRAGTIALGFFATPQYLSKHGAPKSWAELTRSHALIGPDRARAPLDALAAAGMPLSPRDLLLRTDSDLAALAAVRAGVGIGIAQCPLATGLVRVLPALRFSLEAWVVTHEDLKNVRRVRLVVDHLTTELARYAQAEIGGKSRRDRPKGA
jgi:DNA-binding transcriptional LysR family regulator